MKRLLLASAFFCWLSSPVNADSETQNCQDPQTQTDMNICANEAFRRADTTLNQLYQQIKNKYAPTQFQQFQKVQINWLKFRDSQCAFEAVFYQGGTIVPLIHANCMESLTQERNQHFKRLLKGPPY